MTIINESGMYSLIFSSKLESAKKFKRWVISEVLPAIRRHGAYIASQATPQGVEAAALQVVLQPFASAMETLTAAVQMLTRRMDAMEQGRTELKALPPGGETESFTPGATSQQRWMRTVNEKLDLLGFNSEAAPALADENVRKAMILAMDKRVLAYIYAGDMGIPCNSSLTGLLSPYYYETGTFTQDMETAKKLIADSSWSAADLTFTMYYISGQSSAQLEVFQAQMNAIGVTINIETTDMATHTTMNLAGEIRLQIGENDNWDVSRMMNYVDSRISTSKYAYRGEYEAELHELIDKAWRRRKGQLLLGLFSAACLPLAAVQPVQSNVRGLVGILALLRILPLFAILAGTIHNLWAKWDMPQNEYRETTFRIRWAALLDAVWGVVLTLMQAVWLFSRTEAGLRAGELLVLVCYLAGGLASLAMFLLEHRTVYQRIELVPGAGGPETKEDGKSP